MESLRALTESLQVVFCTYTVKMEIWSVIVIMVGDVIKMKEKHD